MSNAVLSPARSDTGLFEFRRHWGAAARWCFDLLFPPRCEGCGRVDTVWCAACQHELQAYPLGLVIRDTALPLVGLAASGVHQGRLRDAVQALKYNRAQDVADTLAQRLAWCLAQLDWTFDTLIPVPLHLKRMRQRGYNQANLIANALARDAAMTCQPSAIERHRFTASQVGLGVAERAENVAGAFRGDPEQLRGRAILLIDDVLTTGATLGACAQAAMAAGATRVYGLTVTAA